MTSSERFSETTVVRYLDLYKALRLLEKLCMAEEDLGNNVCRATLLSLFQLASYCGLNWGCYVRSLSNDILNIIIGLSL